jgi:hypothetical protein
MDRQFEKDSKTVPRLKISKYLSKGKNISSTYLISITSLPKDEQTSKNGEEVGTMEFRFQGGANKKRESEK